MTLANRQIVLIQLKSNVFVSIENAKNVIASWFNSFVEKYDYTLTLDEITYEQDFWNYIEGSEELYELELIMKSPNLFGSRVEATELLKDINHSFNNTESSIKVTNEKGKLRVVRERIQSFIKYISNGGGEWILKLKPINGRKIRKIRSKRKIKIVEFISEENIKHREIVIEEINKIDEVIKDVTYNSKESQLKQEDDKP